MKITYVGDVFSSIASHRYRILLPSKYLGKKEVEVYTGDPDDDTDIAVYTKHFNYGNIDHARNSPCITVFDICDYHFESRHVDYYRSMMAACDYLTCSTEFLKDQIKIQVNREAEIISDPYEFYELPPEFEPKEYPRLMWFGHKSNLEALKNIPLRGYTTIVTECEETDMTPVKWVPYSADNVIYHAREADLILIPQILDNRGKSKGPNRLIESLRMGKFVIASEIPSYLEFKDFCYIGDIKEGIEWAYANKEEVRNRIRAGQKYIKEHYSPESIGEQWRALFCSILVRGKRSSRATSTSTQKAETFKQTLENSPSQTQ